MKLKNTIGAALLGAMAVLLGAGAQAQERWWPAAVKDMSGKAPVALQYQPGEKATKPWRICALFPHMKDTIWLAVNYGIVEEARRQGVAVTIYQAGGYENLPRQLSQFDDCMAAGFDALKSGQILGFATQYPVLQGRIAVDLAIKALQKEKVPSFVAPVPAMVTTSTLPSINTSLVLAPASFQAVYSVAAPAK